MAIGSSLRGWNTIRRQGSITTMPGATIKPSADSRARDPDGFGAGDTNLYRYSSGDPTDETDKSGLSSTSAVFWTPPGEHPASTKTSHLAGMEGIITVLVFRARRLAWPVYTQGGVGAAPKRSSAGLDPRGRRRAATRGGYIRRKRGKPAGSCEPSSNRRRPY